MCSFIVSLLHPSVLLVCKTDSALGPHVLTTSSHPRKLVCAFDLFVQRINGWRRRLGETEWLTICMHSQKGVTTEWMTVSRMWSVSACMWLYLACVCVRARVPVCLWKAGQGCGSGAVPVWDSIRFLSTLEPSVLPLALELLLSHKLLMAGLLSVWWCCNVGSRK